MNFIPDEMEIDDCAVTDVSAVDSNEQFMEFTFPARIALLAIAAQMDISMAAVFLMRKSLQVNQYRGI